MYPRFSQLNFDSFIPYNEAPSYLKGTVSGSADDIILSGVAEHQIHSWYNIGCSTPELQSHAFSFSERMNILRADKRSTIITLLKNGVSQREIKRKTNIDRKTIRKYARQYHLMSAIEGSNTRSPTMGEGAICQEDRSEKRDSQVEKKAKKKGRIFHHIPDHPVKLTGNG